MPAQRLRGCDGWIPRDLARQQVGVNACATASWLRLSKYPPCNVQFLLVCSCMEDNKYASNSGIPINPPACTLIPYLAEVKDDYC